MFNFFKRNKQKVEAQPKILKPYEDTLQSENEEDGLYIAIKVKNKYDRNIKDEFLNSTVIKEKIKYNDIWKIYDGEYMVRFDLRYKLNDGCFYVTSEDLVWLKKNYYSYKDDIIIFYSNKKFNLNFLNNMLTDVSKAIYRFPKYFKESKVTTINDYYIFLGESREDYENRSLTIEKGLFKFENYYEFEINFKSCLINFDEFLTIWDDIPIKEIQEWMDRVDSDFYKKIKSTNPVDFIEELFKED